MAEVLNRTITRKQANVIFACAKSGKIKLERWQMSSIYNLADKSDDVIIDWNGSIRQERETVRDILDNIFAGDFEKAQARIDKFYNLADYGKSFRDRADRSLIG